MAGFTDYGLEQMGSFIGGLSPTSPAYIAFGAGSQVFYTGSQNLESESFRQSLSWTFFNGDMVGNTTISSAAANGSYINEIGLGIGSTFLGSDLYTRDFSSIGSKNNTFDVDLSLTVKFLRG